MVFEFLRLGVEIKDWERRHLFLILLGFVAWTALEV